MQVLDDTRCHLGEGPVWDVAAQALYWVDSLGPTVYRHDWTTRATRCWDLGGDGDYVGSLAVRKDGNGLILAMGKGFYLFDMESGRTDLIKEPLADQPHSRFNDGKVDRAGRFVAGGVNGSAGSDQQPQPQPVCGMFAVEPDLNVRQVLGEFACFNGPSFSPDGETFYVTGRGDMAHIEAFRYDTDTGTVGDRHILIDGIDPDGATVDADGYIWSAQWEAGCVLRVSPNGKIHKRIDVPGHIVSSVMFGGPDLDILFVTTLGEPHWGTVPTAPDAGAVFVIRDVGCRGLPEPRFGG